MRVMKNPDEEFVKEFRQKLKDNGGYCPCRLTKTPDTKCICKEFKAKIADGELGYCHCGLYYVAE